MTSHTVHITDAPPPMHIPKICIVVSLLSLLGCQTTGVQSPPAPNAVYDKWGCKLPSDAVVTTNKSKFELASAAYKSVTVQGIKAENDPNLFPLLSEASRDAGSRDYLRCLAKNRDNYTFEQVAYFESLNSFLSLKPTADQFIQWQREHPAPISIPTSNGSVPSTEPASKAAPGDQSQTATAVSTSNSKPKSTDLQELDWGRPESARMGKIIKWSNAHGEPVRSARLDRCINTDVNVVCYLVMTNLERKPRDYPNYDAASMKPKLYDDAKIEHTLVQSYFVNGRGQHQKTVNLSSDESAWMGLEFESGAQAISAARIVFPDVRNDLSGKVSPSR